MSRILFAWELGANYGHLARDLPVAERLRAAGHSVIFVVRDTRVAAELLTPRRFAFFQAPMSPHPARLVRPPANYAEMLLVEGWGDRLALLGRVKAWLSLIALARPDAIVADHAPAGLLAARIAEIPAVAFGNGFEIPPPVSPLPSIRPWEAISGARLEQSEAMVLDLLNAVSTALGGKPLMRLADLFPPNPVFATFAELDHYGERPGANYVGSIHDLKAATTVLWPEGDGLRVFAYLRPNQRATGATLAALAEGNFRAVCAVPGAGKEFIRKCATSSLAIHPGPVALSPLFMSGAVAIGYGGSGTIAMTLMAGAPQLMIPQTVEQYLCSKRVEALGAGIVLDRERSKNSIRTALDKFITDPAYSRAAMSFANKNCTLTPARAAVLAAEAILAACGARCEEISDVAAHLLN